jgi:hypothetical protein
MIPLSSISILSYDIHISSTCSPPQSAWGLALCDLLKETYRFPTVFDNKQVFVGQ